MPDKLNKQEIEKLTEQINDDQTKASPAEKRVKLNMPNFRTFAKQIGL